MLPVRGLHLSAPSKGELGLAEKFIREVLPKEGVTHLVLEFDYEFAYKSHPTLGNPKALDEAKTAPVRTGASHRREHRMEPASS